MEGDVADLPLTELVQLLCMGGHNRDIQLFDGPTWLGVVSVRDGQLDQCFAYGTWGRSALFKLFAVRRGRYRVTSTESLREEERLSSYSWQGLLLDSARQEDEDARLVAGTGRVLQFSREGTQSASSRELGASDDYFDLAFSSVMPPADRRATPLPTEKKKRPRTKSAQELAAFVPSPTPNREPPRLIPAAVPPPPVVPLRTPDEIEFADSLERATASYLRREFDEALRLLERCLVLRPDDKRILQNIERITRRRNSP